MKQVVSCDRCGGGGIVKKSVCKACKGVGIVLKDDHGDPLQDGMLAYYNEQAPFADANIERELSASEFIDIALRR